MLLQNQGWIVYISEGFNWLVLQLHMISVRQQAAETTSLVCSCALGGDVISSSHCNMRSHK